MSPRASLVLAAAVAAAALLGLHRLGEHTLTHPEAYAPGIPLPEYVEHPPERATLRDVVVDTLFDDIHPPGYYVAMLPWVKAAGSSLVALRLPSVLAAAATVLLAFGYARRAAGESVALATAVLLALHGHLALWAQQARPWALLTALGVASAWLLLRIDRAPLRRDLVPYVLVAALSLWVEYYAWLLFAAQLAWTLSRSRERAHPALPAQLVALLLAAPVLLYLARQISLRGPPVPFAPADLGSLAGFGNLLSRQWLRATLGDAGSYVEWGFAALGAAAIAWGVRVASARVTAMDAPAPEARYYALAGAAAAALALTVSVAFWGIAPRASLVASALGVVAAGASLSLVLFRGERLAALAAVAQRVTPRDLTLCLLLLPALLLAACELAGVRVVAARGLLAFAPFAVVAALRGVFAIRPVALRRASVAALLALAALTSRTHLALPPVRDYQALALALRPRLDAATPVLGAPIWQATPMHYYLPPQRYRLVAPEALPTLAAGRIWLVAFGPEDVAERELAAMLGREAGTCRELERLRERRITALQCERTALASASGARHAH